MTQQKRRLAAIPVLLVIVALLLVSERVHHALLDVLGRVHVVAVDHTWIAAGLVVTLAAMGAMIAFVSSWVVLPFAVYTWGFTQALLLLWVGWLLGGIASYAMGRFLGRPAVSWLAAADVLERYERRVSHRSTFGLILLLQLGLPSEIPGYLLGLVRYPFAWYVLALGAAELVQGVPAVMLGAGIVQRHDWLVALIAGVMLVVTLAAAQGLRRWWAQEPAFAAPVA